MEGKEVYGRSFYGRLGDGFWGALGFAERSEILGWDCISQAPGCWRFWARGPGYPYDILELGSYLVGRVELGFGQCFTVQQRSRRKADNRGLLASGSGI
jgi:hypothetical protein